VEQQALKSAVTTLYAEVDSKCVEAGRDYLCPEVVSNPTQSALPGKRDGIGCRCCSDHAIPCGWCVTAFLHILT